MAFKKITSQFSVSGQISLADVDQAAAQGIKSIICNRPDDEEPGQLNAGEVEQAAMRHGIAFAHVPAISGAIQPVNVQDMAKAIGDLPSPILAYCRSGARSTKLFEMARDMPEHRPSPKIYDFVIIGGGSAGIATAASILKRNRDVSLAIIEPSEVHYYQPGWTMGGAGVVDAEFTRREEAKLIPPGAEWIKASPSGFEPEQNKVLLKVPALV